MVQVQWRIKTCIYFSKYFSVFPWLPNAWPLKAIISQWTVESIWIHPMSLHDWCRVLSLSTAMPTEASFFLLHPLSGLRTKGCFCVLSTDVHILWTWPCGLGEGVPVLFVGLLPWPCVHNSSSGVDVTLEAAVSLGLCVAVELWLLPGLTGHACGFSFSMYWKYWVSTKRFNSNLVSWALSFLPGW